ncbi:sel-1 -like protein [Brachionus plicatilis]|uniref:Sel-1-like protein n=1 Tax=Brachionus plicatilis TaxID=10195 RepID=A0A3M7RV08_BRAPC|nr:sel-1 -like protein [Brachionus plicatilis]
MTHNCSKTTTFLVCFLVFLHCLAAQKNDPTASHGQEKPANPLAQTIQDLSSDEQDTLETKKATIEPETFDPLADKDYSTAMSKINGSKQDNDYRGAIFYLNKAAQQGHDRAREELAVQLLFGDHIARNITAATEIFQDLSSRKGYPRSQFYLGFVYASGLGVKSNQAKALTYFTFAALGGDSLAQMALGYRYWASINVVSSCEMALSYYKQVAQDVASKISTNSVGTVINRIRIYDEEEKVTSQSQAMLDDDLVQYYQLLADRGDVQAQYGLGLLHYQGARGLSIQYDKAFYYFSKAAESGNNYAMAYLGKLYLEGGDHVKQDNITALKYFKLASEKGNPIGQSGLGMIYFYGSGVEKDFAKALKFFQMSADQGYVEGYFMLGIMHFYGYGVRKDFKSAVKYFNLAAQFGHVLGYFNLAQMHATGTGVLRSCPTAAELYKNVAERGTSSLLFSQAYHAYKEGDLDKSLVKYMLLAELGYEVAQSNVAYILDQFSTRLFDKSDSLKRALANWNRAATQGYHVARLKLGDYYYYGKGTDIDYQQAASHYKYASEVSQNPQAMFNLAYMHENGLGLRKDIHLAKRFYDMAWETSVDAHVPVALALFKLAIMFYVDGVFSKYNFLLGLVKNPSIYFGSMWDIYLMSLLAGLISFMYVLRRRI